MKNTLTIIEAHDPGSETVYFSYFSYPFILELSLSHLKHVNEDELFNFQHGDVAIFPKNKEWLIAYSPGRGMALHSIKPVFQLPTNSLKFSLEIISTPAL